MSREDLQHRVEVDLAGELVEGDVTAARAEPGGRSAMLAVEVRGEGDGGVGGRVGILAPPDEPHRDGSGVPQRPEHVGLAILGQSPGWAEWLAITTIVTANTVSVLATDRRQAARA